MRNIRLFVVLALLALPVSALAQTTASPSQATDPAQPAVGQSQTTSGPSTSTDGQSQTAAKPAASTDQSSGSGIIKDGSIDLGSMGSSVTGDAARYNRYRDLSNGAFIDGFRTRLEGGGWLVNFMADHVARADARYGATFAKPGTIEGSFQWDQIRELVSNTTKSLFTEVAPGVFRVDDNVQNALQTALGPPSTVSTVLPAMLADYARPFPLSTDRHIASGTFHYLVDKDTTVNFDVDHTNRTGNILYSGTFGFSNAVDIPEPIDQHTTNANMNVDHQIGDLTIRAGFTGSYFRNDIPVITWDNPYRYTDLATLSSQGRTSVAPSNDFSVFNASFSEKLARHSRVAGYVAFGFLDDDGATVIPQTINTAIAVVPLFSNTVGGQGQTKNANLSFVSRPIPKVNVDVRYRYYDYNNLTPVWTNTSRVAYDSALQVSTPTAPLASLSTDRYGGSKQTFTADVHIIAPGGGSIGVGYARNQATYNDRIFAGSGENVAHVSFDALSTQYVSLHAKYEHAIRRGTGLDTTDLVADGEQPMLQTFDIADRNRDLFTVAASVFPVNGLAIEFTAGDGQDSYPSTNFGLTNAKHYTYGVDVNVDPNEHVNLNAGYNVDDFNGIEWSRNAASPPPAAVFYDPSKDWSDTNHDRTQEATAGLNFVRLHDKVDVRFGYDYNKGRGTYVYGLGSAPLDPVVASTLPAPVQLPTLVSDLTRGTFDVSYAFTSKVSMGFSFWYEKFNVNDFGLGATALPGLNLTTTDVLMGYTYQPYTAKTAFARIVCHW